MKQSEEFENILDECLEMVFGGESIGTCLENYPEHAAELKPLLETVIGAKSATDIKPRPEFRREAFYEFQAAVRDLPPLKSAGFFSFQQWWVTAAAVVAVIVLGGGGTAMAANSSLPDSFLYPVKLATESARIALTFSDEGKTELYAQFADRRVDEMVAMAEQGRTDAVNRAADNLDRQLIAMVGVVAAPDTDAARPESAAMFSKAEEAPQAEPAPLPAPDEMPVEPEDTSGDIMAAAPPARGTVEESALPGRSAPAAAEAPWLEGQEPSQFKLDIAEQAAEAVRKLQGALATAQGKAREALEKALELLYERYDEVLRNIR
ncbi:MAG: DUF5667 domain-containing protein [Dehalococcoidales bacterium]|nr:DUF5667 domain-containing protein [Dehalococcoidales bacterium]